MIRRIPEIEEEVRQLHFGPVPIQLSWSQSDTKSTLSGFWTYHIKPVIEIAKRLAGKYNQSDFCTVWLAALLHDIARIYDKEPHDEIGAEMAKDFLQRHGICPGFNVRSTIMTHSCLKHKPTTLEQKILATADAMAHFQQPFYVWFSHITSQTFEEQQASMMRKLDHDFNHKIFFDEERESVRPHYEVMKSWLNT
jgi:HD superfamily phosphohydrolase YqeK